MKRSTSHILTTHTGSLPRSPGLQELLRLREEGRPLDQAAFAAGSARRWPMSYSSKSPLVWMSSMTASKSAPNMPRMLKSASPALRANG